MHESKALVVKLSPFIARIVAQQPDAIQWRGEQVKLPELDSYLPTLNAALASCTSELEAHRVVRQQRQRWYASLAAADLLEQLSVKAMLQHLSKCADAFIEASLTWLQPRFNDKFGTPRNESGEVQPLLVIGMGKLGGGELNFSSDIDLIFCYPEQGETDHPTRPRENSVYFTKLAQALIAMLDTQTADGRVFRVDLRLRPFGQSGPLVVSLAALEYYYQEQGRDWERYAMVKARVIGAESSYQRELSKLLRPFVYRRYIDFSAIDALRKMKSLITQETRRLGVHNNIKLGPGGIREIEFIAQAFQIIRGGQQRQLQTQSLYQAFAAIKQQQLMPATTVDELIKCYEHLRRVENVLQEINDEQTQTLPDCADTQAAVALAFNTNWVTLRDSIAAAMETVHGHFMQVIGDPDAEDEEAGALQLLWQDMIEDDAAISVLQDAGLGKATAQQLWTQVNQLRQEVRKRGSGPRGRKAMSRLVPLLLDRIIQLPDAEFALEKVFQVLRKIMTRTAYVELLVENSGAREQLLKLCRASSWVTTQLSNYPLLLDELIDPAHLYELPKLSEYPQLLDEYLIRIPEQEADLEAQMDALRQARQVMQLKVAAADISGGISLMKVSDHLSYLAEAVIQKVVHLAWHQLAEKHGVPPQRNAENMGFAVVAYGKLGGLELGYGSDLDLVFIADADYSGETDGPRTIEVQQFYLRLAQRILHLFTTRTLIGILYDVDMRLRPSGSAGLLVSRLDTFANYLAEDAWTWELQALVRARPVFGDSELQSKLAKLRVQQLSRARNAEQLKNDVVTMREKMRDHLHAKVGENEFDLKQGAGGITDIEFLVQYIALRYSAETPELTTYTDNIRILEAAGQLGIMTEEQAADLITAYIAQREVLHQLALDNRGSITHQALDQHRQVVMNAWQRWLGTD